MEARLPEAEAAVTEIRVDIPVDTEAIRVVPWQEVLKQEMSDRLKWWLFLDSSEWDCWQEVWWSTEELFPGKEI